MIAWTDWKIKRIPNSYIGGFLLSGILDLIQGTGTLDFFSMNQWIGSIIISVPLLWVACMVPGSIGGGDIKLMAAGGFLLGITEIWNAFVIGITSAGVYVAILLLAKKLNRKSQIALGPFLSMGLIIAFIK